MIELAAQPASPVLGTVAGLAFLVVGALLLGFRKRAQALYMALMRSGPEGKFVSVIKYIYAPVFFIFFGVLLFVASVPKVFGH